MAEAGPYGITQFDAPGIIGAYQTAQRNRIQMMYEQKQLEQLDRTTKNEAAVQKAVEAYYSNGSPASPQPATAPSASSTPSAPADPLAPLPDAPAAAPAAPAAAPAMPDRQKLIGTLLAIDAPTAEKYMNVFSAMDKAQAEQVALKNTHAMQIMGGLLQLPIAQRQAAIQQAAPELQQLGYTPQQIAGFVPSDENLRGEMAKHMDAAQIMTFVKPEINAVAQGGSLEQSTPSGQTKTLYETPTIAGPNGEVFARPGAMSAKPQTATNPKTGQKLQFNSQTNQWEPLVGGQTAPPSGGFQ